MALEGESTLPGTAADSERAAGEVSKSFREESGPATTDRCPPEGCGDPAEDGTTG